MNLTPQHQGTTGNINIGAPLRGRNGRPDEELGTLVRELFGGEEVDDDEEDDDEEVDDDQEVEDGSSSKNAIDIS